MTAASAMAGRKPSLRPKRRRRDVEREEFVAFVRRALRALGGRVADGDVEGLAALEALHADVDAELARAVGSLRRDPHSHSWARIAGVIDEGRRARGDDVGFTRQAAMQRWPDAGGDRRPGGQPAHLR